MWPESLSGGNNALNQSRGQVEPSGLDADGTFVVLNWGNICLSVSHLKWELTLAFPKVGCVLTCRSLLSADSEGTRLANNKPLSLSLFSLLFLSYFIVCWAVVTPASNVWKNGASLWRRRWKIQQDETSSWSSWNQSSAQRTCGETLITANVISVCLQILCKESLYFWMVLTRYPTIVGSG